MLAILSYTLREMPENADLVEKIVFDEKMDLLVFLRHSNNLLKYRTCMLLRLLGRFSCYTLQTRWTTEMGVAMEALLTDQDEQTRKVSRLCAIDFQLAMKLYSECPPFSSDTGS